MPQPEVVRPRRSLADKFATRGPSSADVTPAADTPAVAMDAKARKAIVLAGTVMTGLRSKPSASSDSPGKSPKSAT